MSKTFWPDTQRVEHAGFTVDIARAAIRNVTYQGAQIIDLLYTAIRPWDWSTLDPDEHSEVVEISGENCLVTITDLFAGSMQGKTVLTLQPNGKFTIDYQLSGLGKFEINRWGVCFCLNTGDWMGSKVSASENTYSLLKEISPQRVINGITQGLFPASNNLHFIAPDKRSLKVLSTGKVLEAEDQRNWTDNTYKIYSGSLAEPRPFVIEKGMQWEQQVEFEVTPPTNSIPDGSKIIAKDIPSLPRIGVQFNGEPLLPSDDLEKALFILDIDHIRINEESLTAQKIATISKSGLVLEAALLSSNDGAELVREVEHLSARVPAGSRLLINRQGRQIVQGSDLPKNKTLNSYIPGSDAYLVDLHREEFEFGDAVSYSMVPTVHSSDPETIFKTLYTQKESIEFAKKFVAPQVSISPITFSTRGNPETGHLRDNRINFAQPEMAAQIKELSAAAWTLGSVFALASAGAYSGTWHELFGEFGVIYSEGSAIKFSPTFHALSALGAHHAHELTIATSLDSSWVAFEDRESRKMVVASQRPWNVDITPKALVGYKSIQSLRADECEKASQIMDWWSYAEINPLISDIPLSITPFEILLLRG
jgi:D-apionolactonase